MTKARKKVKAKSKARKKVKANTSALKRQIAALQAEIAELKRPVDTPSPAQVRAMAARLPSMSRAEHKARSVKAHEAAWQAVRPRKALPPGKRGWKTRQENAERELGQAWLAWDKAYRKSRRHRAPRKVLNRFRQAYATARKSLGKTRTSYIWDTLGDMLELPPEAQTAILDHVIGAPNYAATAFLLY
jgi:hypothetical protein